MSEKIEALRREFVDALASFYAHRSVATPADAYARALLAALAEREVIRCERCHQVRRDTTIPCTRCGPPLPPIRSVEWQPNTKTPIGGWIKAVFMQEGDLPTVADCCRLAALVEHGVVGSHEHARVVEERDKLADVSGRWEKAALSVSAERDEWARNHATVVESYNKACAANEHLEVERDELKRRIGRARGYLEHRKVPCPIQLVRILEGREP